MSVLKSPSAVVAIILCVCSAQTARNVLAASEGAFLTAADLVKGAVRVVARPVVSRLSFTPEGEGLRSQTGPGPAGESTTMPPGFMSRPATAPAAQTRSEGDSQGSAWAASFIERPSNKCGPVAVSPALPAPQSAPLPTTRQRPD